VVGTGAARSLVADISFAGHDIASNVPLLLSAGAGSTATVPVLNLEIGAIDLNVLGLGVHTSDICLDITATPGAGLLGNLLGGVAGGLGGGLNLGNILDNLSGTAGQVGRLLGGIDRLLDGVLGQSMEVTGLFGQGVNGNDDPAPADEGFCNILNLSLGPVDLHLLGLNVSLDNCEDPAGPVTVDITGQDGTLLGGLLCGLADGVNLDGLNVGRLVGQLDRLFDRLDNILDRAGDLGNLDNRTIDRIERVIDQFQHTLDRLQDRGGELRNLERVIDRLGHLADQVDALGDRLDAIIDRLQGLLEGASSGRGRAA